ncbi:MAG TPA: GNAT family N-acetyltransferase [Alphaproteobacteria bacterium]
MSPDVRTRPMTVADMAMVLDWAAAEGWNPGRHDGDCFRAIDPGGFIIGELDGAPVASISVVNYDHRFAFLGFYIVPPDLRGRGYGWRTWQAGLAHGGARNIGLDGVVAQQDNYRKSGFKLAYRNIRFTGRVAGGEAPADRRLVNLAAIPFDELVAYDRPLFPAPRSGFLRAWAGHPAHVALGLVERDALVGYGVLRPCRQDYKIGPLFADSEDAANILFEALSAQAGGPVYLDVPEVNPAAVALAERHGMTPVFETARMYTGPAPAVDLARVFGVTSFELG